MTLETFQAVKFGGSKGGPGASVYVARKRGVVVAKRAERAGNTAITVNLSKARRYRTGGGYWTRSDEFCEYGETALSRSFGRSEGNGIASVTSPFLVRGVARDGRRKGWRERNAFLLHSVSEVGGS